MKILEDLISDRRTLTIMVIAFAITMVVALLIIWYPEKVSDISKYKPYDEEQKVKELSDLYFRAIADIGVYNRISSLDELSEDYLLYTNQTIEDVFERFKANGAYPAISEVSYLTVGNEIIYMGRITTKSNSFQVNIIESYPYNVRLTLDSFYSYRELDESDGSNGVNVILKSEYRDLEYIEYNIEVENNTSSNIEVDFSSSGSVYLKYKDGSRVFMSNPYTDEKLRNLEPNDVGNRSIIFNTNVLNQEGIDSLCIDSINVNGKQVRIEINI